MSIVNYGYTINKHVMILILYHNINMLNDNTDKMFIFAIYFGEHIGKYWCG